MWVATNMQHRVWGTCVDCTIWPTRDNPQEMYTAVHARDTSCGEDRETREEVRGVARGKSKSDGETEGHAEVESVDDVTQKSDEEEAATDYESEESEEEWTESGAEE